MNRRTFARLALAALLAGCTPPPTLSTPAATPQSNANPGSASTPSPAPTQLPAGTQTPVPTVLPAATPAAQPSPPGTPSSAALAGSFAAYKAVSVSVKPSVPAYTIPADLTGIKYFEFLKWLNNSQKQLLAQNGFLVVQDTYQQPYPIYSNNHSLGIFITTDALLHTFHILYDFVLRTVELDKLYGELTSLNTAMLASAQKQESEATGAVKAAAHRNVAYFAVAARLLDDKAQVPASVAQPVNAEIANIMAHQGFMQSPIFGYQEDYSQYVPRGHYTRNDQFQRYFRAMMWYGRMIFRLHPGDSAQDIESGRSETRSALLIVSTLNSANAGGQPAIKRWDAIYEPTSFFVGSADDLTPADYSMLLQQVYGSSTPPLSAFEDTTKLDAFIARARALRKPGISSSMVTEDQDAATVTQGFRMMGQRYIPDSYMLQQLVDSNVKSRYMPKGLDVMAALGSGRALDILTQVFNENKYPDYLPQMQKLRDEFGKLPETTWHQNLYWNWLYALLPLLGQAYGEGYPTFMRNQAWLDKQLFTSLGSWAELRHDTILYAKQSMTTAGAAAPPPELPPVYVEPQPEVFARLAAVANQMRSGLNARNLLSQEFDRKLQTFEQLALQLKNVAELELNNQPVPQSDTESLRHIGSALESLATLSQSSGNQITSETDQNMAVVADVHTDPNTNTVLEEGVGSAFPIFVVVPTTNGLAIAQGAHFSYYEFTQPINQRLTDEAWQKLNPKPPLPVWTSSFLSGKTGG